MTRPSSATPLDRVERRLASIERQLGEIRAALGDERATTLLSQDEVKKRFRVGADRLREARMLGELPYSREGKRVLYRESDVVAWLMKDGK